LRLQNAWLGAEGKVIKMVILPRRKQQSQARYAVFGLVRGYQKLSSKWRYSMQILRNVSIRVSSLRAHEKWDIIVLHEGNISRSDQIFLKIASLGPIEFIDIGMDFVKPDHLKHSGVNGPLGYALMCRFHYLHVWKYIKDYDVAMRLDEDCFLIKAVPLGDKFGFSSAGFCPETHESTNRTLLPFLESINLGASYDHNFPYTNFYITRPKPWLSQEVSQFLELVGNQDGSLDERWGDIPVLGVALNVFPAALGPVHQLKQVSYIHLSHIAWVRKGEFKSVDFVIDIKRPIKTLRSIFGSPGDSQS
jgi:hypothetical protein